MHICRYCSTSSPVRYRSCLSGGDAVRQRFGLNEMRTLMVTLFMVFYSYFVITVVITDNVGCGYCTLSVTNIDAD